MSPSARRITLITAILCALIAGVLAVIVLTRPSAPAAEPGATRPSAVDASSHVLSSAPDERVVVVEFLDFECETCAAFHPIVEQLRTDFAGEVTFVQRYFPLPGHKNSMTAALAAEAAASQGRLDEMSTLLFESQETWGEKQDSEAATFRQFAQDLGLDMAAYDAAVADPATRERVIADMDAGKMLGVTGTPTFFVNDEPVHLTAFGDIRAAIEAALAGH